MCIVRFAIIPLRPNVDLTETLSDRGNTHPSPAAKYAAPPSLSHREVREGRGKRISRKGTKKTRGKAIATGTAGLIMNVFINAPVCFDL